MISMRRKAKHHFIRTALILTFVAAFLLPIAWMVINSFRSLRDFSTSDFVFTPTLQNYISVLGKSDFSKYYLNSIVIGLSVIGLTFLIGMPAAYGIGRLRFRGRNQIAYWILSTSFGSPISALIPYFLLFRNLGLLDNVLALIIIQTAFFLPFVVWMMSGFFEEIPRELEEAALIDGCSRFSAFIRVLMPVALPGLSATAIITFIFSWNEFLFAFVLAGVNAKTAPLSVYSYMGAITGQINWGLLTATGVLVTLPMLIFALIVQRNIIRGLTLGAVKS